MNLPPAQDHPSVYGGHGPAVLKFTWTLVAIYTILLSLRTYVRLKVVREGGSISLILAFVAWIWGIAAASLLTRQVLHGVGNHQSIVEGASVDQVKLSLLNWVYHSVQSTDFPVARFSVLAFLLDVQGQTHLIFRRVLLIICILGFPITIITLVVLYSQCNPASKLWDPGLPGTCPDERANANLGMAVFSGAWGAFTDLCLALFPIYLVRNLQMYFRTKLLVIALMGLGVFSTACSIMRTYYLKTVPGASNRTQDFTYHESYLYFWQSAELWTILITGSLPPLWPLMRRALGAKRVSGYVMGSEVAGRGRLRTTDSEIPLPTARPDPSPSFSRVDSSASSNKKLKSNEIEMKTVVTVEHERRREDIETGSVFRRSEAESPI